MVAGKWVFLLQCRETNEVCYSRRQNDVEKDRLQPPFVLGVVGTCFSRGPSVEVETLVVSTFFWPNLVNRKKKNNESGIAENC
jgi:hypothetical protein